MALQDRIRAAHAFDPSRFLPFLVDGVCLGRVRGDLVAHLRPFAGTFLLSEDAVTLQPGLDTFERRTTAMAVAAKALAAQGMLSPWRNETYDIAADGKDGQDGAKTAAFALERAAVRFFGFASHAVHVNGLVDAEGERRMWIARRSPSKAIDPGMFDTIVGGGLASGLSIAATLVKESWEEAGIPAALAASARPAARLQVMREVPEGLHAETIHVYDLVLPPDFLPQNQDGEVAGFRCLPLRDVMRELEGDAPYTVDASLVAIDCLQRRGTGQALNSPD